MSIPRLIYTLALSVSLLTSCSGYNDSLYTIEETQWQRFIGEVKYNFKHLTPPTPPSGTIRTDSLVSDSTIAKGAELHYIVYDGFGETNVPLANGEHIQVKTRDGYYYKDPSGRMIEVLYGVCANNGMLWSPEEFYYIKSNGMVGFNIWKATQFLWLCFCVFVLPFLFVGLIMWR